MRYILIFMTFVALPSPAQTAIEEVVVVTGAYAESSPPAQRVVRKGDYLLLKVLISNDTREEKQRETEIHKTLLAAIQKASRTPNIQLSSVTDNDFVIPLRESNHRIELGLGKRPDTSVAYFRVKAAIDPDAADGEALVVALRRFVSDLKMEGRTTVEVKGDVEISIVDPSQYRPRIIELMAQDVKAVTAALGGDYRVVLSGIDRPVKWARLGSLDVTVFIPYEYLVLPSSVTSINMFPEY